MNMLKLSFNLESYLETVYKLELENQSARVKDISRAMKVTKPAVVGAVKRLKEKGLVLHDSYTTITLSDKGREMAADFSRRLTITRLFLVDILNIAPETADDQAAGIAHSIEISTAERLASVSQFLTSDSPGLFLRDGV